MSDSTKDLLSAIEKALLRCWLFGFLILILWLGATLLLGDTILNAHGAMFGVTRHELDLIFYCGMGLWKLAVIVCFFLPWLSIKMVLKKSA